MLDQDMPKELNTNHSSWSDWDIDATRATHLHETRHHQHSCSHNRRNLQCDLLPTKNRQKHTTPHRKKGHRHAGSSVIVSLQHHTPPDKVRPPDLNFLYAASQPPPREHNMRGPHYIRHWTPPLITLKNHRVWWCSPHPPQHSTSQICFKSGC